MAKKRVQERAVVVDRGDNVLQRAMDEVKHVSGFSVAMPIRARLAGAAVEYEFLVADTQQECEQALMNMRLDHELRNR